MTLMKLLLNDSSISGLLIFEIAMEIRMDMTQDETIAAGLAPRLQDS